MKNFDIEQLERKNIYKTPDNFFASMQENVLKQAVHAPVKEITRSEAKIIPMKTNWLYAAAAALALLLGLGFFIRNINSTPDNNQLAANNTAVETLSAQSQNAGTTEPFTVETTQPGDAAMQDLTFEENSNQNIAQTETAVSNRVKAVASNVSTTKTSVTKTAKVNKEEPLEQILTSFTSAELAEMSKDAEMDVYLDLYN